MSVSYPQNDIPEMLHIMAFVKCFMKQYLWNASQNGICEMLHKTAFVEQVVDLGNLCS